MIDVYMFFAALGFARIVHEKSCLPDKFVFCPKSATFQGRYRAKSRLSGLEKVNKQSAIIYAMADVRVLAEGVLEENKKLKASSTVTLVRSDKNIIVDTGSFSDGQKIVDALAKEQLRPENVDVVVLTHLHIDHTRNTNIFPNAVLYVWHSKSGSKWDVKDTTVENVVLDNLEIAKDVKIILTPGHFPFHVSVAVNTENGIVVVAGDAVSKKEALGNILRPQWNNKEYLRSQKKILEIADYIVPGHGKMFKVEK